MTREAGVGAKGNCYLIRHQVELAVSSGGPHATAGIAANRNDRIIAEAIGCCEPLDPPLPGVEQSLTIGRHPKAGVTWARINAGDQVLSGQRVLFRGGFEQIGSAEKEPGMFES